MYQYITCSTMDALQWMGAVRMRVQTADKNITIIHKKSSNEKVVSSEWGEKYAQIKHNLQAKTVQCYYGLWTDILARNDSLKLKCLSDGFVSYKRTAFRFTRCYLMDWSGVDYCDVFYQLFWLSFWRHPFTAEELFVNKWCNATFLQICFKTHHLFASANLNDNTSLKAVFLKMRK